MILGQVLERTRAQGERLDAMGSRLERLELTVATSSTSVMRLEEQIHNAVKWAKGICIFIAGSITVVWTAGKMMGKW